MSTKDFGILVTCEHATNRVPRRFAKTFAGCAAQLESHRGHDPGAAQLAHQLAKIWQAPILEGKCSRLLVELNRSLHHPALWSAESKQLTSEEKKDVLNRYYYPHRQRVNEAIDRLLKKHRRVLHVAVHSFTPVWRGVLRPMQLGLLYDPQRSWERNLATAWIQRLKTQPELAGWNLRRNAPYLGIADGLPTALRRQWSNQRYAGFELEVNQAIVGQLDRRSPPPWIPAIARALP